MYCRLYPGIKCVGDCTQELSANDAQIDLDRCWSVDDFRWPWDAAVMCLGRVRVALGLKFLLLEIVSNGVFTGDCLNTQEGH